MSIFGRSQNSNAPQSNTMSKPTLRSAQDENVRLLTDIAPSKPRNAPTISMNSNNVKKSPISFSAPNSQAANSSNNEVRKLTVGREIAMAGEITACDYLVVEGTLDATLRDGQRIEINQTGLFRGAASVEEADIAGRFEGELSVRGRLRVRGTGKISGRVQYGELEVEAGGQIQGEMVTLAPVAAPALPLGFTAPANNSSANDEPYRATGTN